MTVTAQHPHLGKPEGRLAAEDGDPRVAMLFRPMSAHQIIAVGMTVVLSMLDGFDVMAMTFAAPAIKTAWSINPGQLGLLLSSGLLGMAAGSLLIAPAADLLGRRRLVFLSLLIMMAGTAWTATTHDVASLMASRVFSGLGIGALISVITSLAAEYANARRRDLCLTLMAAGFPLGGILGGLLAASLLPVYGWPAIFIAASAFGLVMLVAAVIFLPEPIAPMIARPGRATLARVNAYLRRCRAPAISQLPAPPQDARQAPFKALFRSGMAGGTIMIASIYFLHVVTLFFVQSWVPSLMAGLGFAPTKAALIGVCVNVGGVIGGPLLGATSMRLGLKRLVLLAIGGGAALTAAFGAIPANFTLLALGAGAMGFFMQSGMMGLYAVIARTFPAHMRASGTGLVIGIGRIGSVLGPAVAGALMMLGISRGGVAIAMAAPALAAALLLLGFRVRAPDTP